MAFGDWYDAAVNFFGGGQGGSAALGNMINLGTGLYNMFRNHDSQAANQMSAMLGASVNPNDPRFKNLAALFEEKNRADAIKNIQNIMTQDARSRARGGGGFIVNPERRDEFRANALNQAFMNAGNNSRIQAANMLSGTAGQYANLIPYQTAQDAQFSKNIGSLGETVADLFRNYGGTSGSTPVYVPQYGPSSTNNDPYFSDVYNG